MKKDNGKSEETKGALVEAAAEVFAEKGFKSATTRDIAARAGMNLASIHYHFGDKQGIYLAVIEEHLKHLQEAVPFQIDFKPGTPPEERLRSIIESVLRRVLFGGSAGGWSIFIRELVDPGAAHDLLLERIARPHFKATAETVAELLGQKASQDDVKLCSLSILSQIVFHRLGRTVLSRLAPDLKYDEESILKLAKHISSFSLLAIKGRREELEASGKAAEDSKPGKRRS